MPSSVVFVVAALFSIASADPEWLLVLSQDITTGGYFTADAEATGEINPDDATASLFSIVGGLPADQYETYKNDADKYQIRMVYNKGAAIDGVVWDYSWTQSNWLTSSTITDSDGDFAPWGASKYCAEFKGLALSATDSTYLDGDGDDTTCWYHAAGSTSVWNGGIPLDNWTDDYNVAQQVDVYVCMGGGCSDTSAITTCEQAADGTYDCAACSGGCDFGFVCDSGECVRDCDLFAIDGYLTQCSAEFDDNEAELAGIQTAITDLTTATDGLETSVTQLEDATDTNTAAIAGLTASSAAIDTRVVELENIVQALRPVDDESATVFNASFWEQNKDLMLALMMLLNIALLVCLAYMSCQKASGKHGYSAVDYASDQSLKA